MENIPNFTPRKITNAELLTLQAFLDTNIENQEVLDVIERQLHQFFSTAATLDDFQHRSFLRWYIEVRWARFNDQDEQWVAQIAIARHGVMALMLGYDVWQKMMKYFVSRTSGQGELEDTYRNVRKFFFSSTAIIGTENTKNVTLESVVQEVQHMERAGDYSLKSATLRERLKRLIASQTAATGEDAYEDPENIAGELLALIHFFIGTEVESIYYIVESFIRPEVAGGGVQQNSKKSSVPQSFSVSPKKPTPPSPPLPPEPPAKPAKNHPSGDDQKGQKMPKSAPPKPPKSPPTKPQAGPPPPPSHKATEGQKKKMSYTDIKTMIESRFDPDTDGQFINVEGVLTLLDNLAEQQGDEKVRELYYFDEEKGKFSWNKELLR